MFSDCDETIRTGYEYFGYCYFFTKSGKVWHWQQVVRTVFGAAPIYYNDFTYWDKYTKSFFEPLEPTDIDRAMGVECTEKKKKKPITLSQ